LGIKVLVQVEDAIDAADAQAEYGTPCLILQPKFSFLMLQKVPATEDCGR
jgi:hypothetical protein